MCKLLSSGLVSIPIIVMNIGPELEPAVLGRARGAFVVRAANKNTSQPSEEKHNVCGCGRPPLLEDPHASWADDGFLQKNWSEYHSQEIIHMMDVRNIFLAVFPFSPHLVLSLLQ